MPFNSFVSAVQSVIKIPEDRKFFFGKPVLFYIFFVAFIGSLLGTVYVGCTCTTVTGVASHKDEKLTITRRDLIERVTETKSIELLHLDKSGLKNHMSGKHRIYDIVFNHDGSEESFEIGGDAELAHIKYDELHRFLHDPSASDFAVVEDNRVMVFGLLVLVGIFGFSTYTFWVYKRPRT